MTIAQCQTCQEAWPLAAESWKSNVENVLIFSSHVVYRFLCANREVKHTILHFKRPCTINQEINSLKLPSNPKRQCLVSAACASQCPPNVQTKTLFCIFAQGICSKSYC